MADNEKKFDISEHILVPKHSKLTDKEVSTLAEKLSTTPEKVAKMLAVILVDDPAIVSLDVSAGDIIKIERQSPTAGKTVYYRGVSNE